jgi:hypothetical protein
MGHIVETITAAQCEMQALCKFQFEQREAPPLTAAAAAVMLAARILAACSQEAAQLDVGLEHLTTIMRVYGRERFEQAQAHAAAKH